MTTFRPIWLGLAVAAVAGPALAACLQPQEQRAVDLRTVQSQLMVAAITCRREDDYNRFVQRFQPDLARAHNTLTAYFRRAHGAAGQRQMDAYITNLANAQSQSALRQGNQFCRNSEALWSSAAGVANVNAVPPLVAQHQIVSAIEAQACSAGNPPASRPAQQRTEAPAGSQRTAAVAQPGSAPR
jgi:hypothetical protein